MQFNEDFRMIDSLPWLIAKKSPLSTMKTTLKFFIFLLLYLLSWQSIHAQSAMQKPNWDHALAAESARRVNADPVLKNLYQLARTGNNRQLLG